MHTYPKGDEGTTGPFKLYEVRKIGHPAGICIEGEPDSVSKHSAFSRFLCKTIYESFAFGELRLV